MAAPQRHQWHGHFPAATAALTQHGQLPPRQSCDAMVLRPIWPAATAKPVVLRSIQLRSWTSVSPVDLSNPYGGNDEMQNIFAHQQRLASHELWPNQTPPLAVIYNIAVFRCNEKLSIC